MWRWTLSYIRPRLLATSRDVVMPKCFFFTHLFFTFCVFIHHFACNCLSLLITSDSLRVFVLSPSTQPPTQMAALTWAWFWWRYLPVKRSLVAKRLLILYYCKYYNIKCLKTTIIVIWCYVNKTWLNLKHTQKTTKQQKKPPQYHPLKITAKQQMSP